MTKIKNKVLVILSALLIFSLAFSLSLATPTTIKASEENTVTPTVNVTTILMDEGASVRTETDNGISSGIRFTMYINAEYYASLTNPVVGMYIARATDATEEDMKLGVLPEKYQHVVATNALAGDAAETVEDTLSFNAVIFNIPEEEFGTALIANGYIVSDGAEVEYAVNPQTRSIAQVASMAIANGMDDEVLFNYVDKALENADQTLAFETTSAKFDVIKDDGKTLDLGLTVPENFTAIVTSSDPEVATVDANGVVTCGTKVGTATIKAQLGNTEVTATVKVADPAPLIVSEETKGVAYLAGNGTANWLASEEELSVLDGDYNGQAIALKVYFNSGYRFNNIYTKDEIMEISLSYKSVTLWFATSHANAGDLYLMESYSSTPAHQYFANRAFMSENSNAPGRHTIAYANSGKWEKWEISMSDYIALLEMNNYEYCKLFNIYGSSGFSMDSVFIGNIEFSGKEAFDGYIVKVDESNYSNVYNSDEGAINGGMISAESLEAFNIAGDYSGNAVKFVIKNEDGSKTTGGANNGGYKIKNAYTATQWEYLAEKYSSISVYMAFTGVEKGTVVSYTASTYPNYFAAKAGGIAFNNEPMWKKVTVSIEDYIALLELSNYQYVPLIRLTTYNGPTLASSNVFFFVGDIFFE